MLVGDLINDSASESQQWLGERGVVGFNDGEAVWMLRSTEVSAVWREGGRLKVLVTILATVLLSQAVGAPDEADNLRMLLGLRSGG